MRSINKIRLTGLSFIALVFLLIFYFISPARALEITWFDESEFPRIQAALKLDDGPQNLSPKHIEIHEGELKNTEPMLLLPPTKKPTAVHLTVLIDTTQATEPYWELIQANLDAFLRGLANESIDLKLELLTLDGDVQELGLSSNAFMENLSQLKFSKTGVFKSFEVIKSHLKNRINSPESQDILMIFNSTPFQDSRPDGVSGKRQQEVIKGIHEAFDLAFIMGHPLSQVHAPKANHPSAEMVDISHQIPGGYLGGFGGDLTSLIPLLLNQSKSHYLLQYYSQLPPGSYSGTSAKWYVQGALSHVQTYQNQPKPDLTIHHLPENEWVASQDEPLTLLVEPKGKMINHVELYFKNKEDQLQMSPLKHKYSPQEKNQSTYSVQVEENDLPFDYLSYYFKVHTPYSHEGSETGMISLPIVMYDDGIQLEAEKIDENTVQWRWHGPTVEKGDKFELWVGDSLLSTTTKTSYTMPIDDCNWYQILQVKVVFPDASISNPSRPHEFYAGEKVENSVSKKEGVTLLKKCLNERLINQEIRPSTSSDALTLEQAGLSFLTMTLPHLIQSIDPGVGHYESIHYIARFLNKEQYQKYGIEKKSMTKAMLYKWVTLANHQNDLENTFTRAINELSNRIRGQQTF